MPDPKKRKAAAERARLRRQIPRVVRNCEDCGNPIDHADSAYDAVLCWTCLEQLNRGITLPRKAASRKSPGAA